MSDDLPLSNRAARAARLPVCMRPLPRPAPRAALRRLQLGAAIVFSLCGLILASVWVESCASSGEACPAPMATARAPEATISVPDALGSAAPEPTQRARPVLEHAFAALPLAFDTEVTRSYVLPPGKTVAELATLEGRLDLSDISLIAIVQAEGMRRALVRLPDGRILRLQEGDALEGGIVAAIGEDALYMLSPDNRPRALLLGG